MKKTNLEAPPRQRTSVPIQGIDVATPDDIVPDGKCSALKNLRYEAGAWRPMCDYTLSEDGVGYNIVYNHIVNGVSHYIGYSTSGSQHFYKDYTNNTNIASYYYSRKITHFGNFLIFYSQNDIDYYLYDNGTYHPFSLPSYCKTRVSNNIGGPYHATRYFEEDTYKYHEYDPLEPPTNATEYWIPIANRTQGVYLLNSESESWSGEIMLFTSYKMVDGTIVSPSPLHLVSSAGAAKSSAKRRIWIGADPLESQGLDWMEEMKLDKYLAIRSDKSTDAAIAKHLPTLNISGITSSNTLIDSLCIWSTRIYPTFEIDEKKWDSTKNGIAKYYADNDLPNQPFYLLKEIKLSSINNGSVAIELSSSLLNGAINNQVYKPSNFNKLFPASVIDYNSQLHIGGYSYYLPDPFSMEDSNLQSDDVGYTSSFEDCEEVVQVSVNSQTHNISQTIRTNLSDEYGVSAGTPFQHIISYPDYRATRYIAEELYDAQLKPAVAINMAWYHPAHTDLQKFPPITIDSRVMTGDESYPYTNYIVCENKIQVSASNNCFNLPFENNYTIGSSSNKIIAINSPAIEMHEMKIGELPLYVFTEEGIFALQAGANTLYASVVPVNHDKIINPNTLAINNAIVYATERGIHLLRGSENVIISTPIHTNGIVDINMLKSCQFINAKAFNELIVKPKDQTYAFVYNLEAGYWSTRDFNYTKLNTDELVYSDGVYDLLNEVETEPLAPTIVTRPIKLGTLEYKRVETMTPRIQRTPTATFGFNCQLWDKWNDGKGNKLGEYTLNQSGIPIGIRRTGSSSQYFTFRFSSDGNTFNIASDFSISHIDFEWYERFRRRMR